MDEADLFLVRVWHQSLGFRASVRRVDEEQVRMFADAEQLARFLAMSASNTTPDDTTDPRSTHPRSGGRPGAPTGGAKPSCPPDNPGC